MRSLSVRQALLAVSAIWALDAASGDTVASDTPTTTTATTGAALPGKGPAQHPFLYAGEWDTRKPHEQSMFIVRDGKVVWQYSMPLRTPKGQIQEFDDATLLSNGNIIFSRMSARAWSALTRSWSGSIRLHQEPKSTHVNPLARAVC